MIHHPPRRRRHPALGPRSGSRLLGPALALVLAGTGTLAAPGQSPRIAPAVPDVAAAPERFVTLPPLVEIRTADLGAEGDMISGLDLDLAGKLVAVGCRASKGGIGRGARGGATVWDLATGKRTATITEVGNRDVNDIGFSPRGDLLAVGDSQGHIVFWDVARGCVTGTIDARTPAEIKDNDERDRQGAARNQHETFGYFAPDGLMFVVPPDPQPMRAWDVATRAEVAPVTRAGIEAPVAIAGFRGFDTWSAPDGGRIALGIAVEAGGMLAADRPITLVLHDLAAGREVWRCEQVDLFAALAASFAPDGRIVLLDGPRHGRLLWSRDLLFLDRLTGQPAATDTAPERIASAQVDPTGRFLFVSGDHWDEAGHAVPRRLIRFVDARTARPILSFFPGDEGGGTATFTRDGRRFALVCSRGVESIIRVWDVAAILAAGPAPSP